jgi:hypothetical protein
MTDNASHLRAQTELMINQNDDNDDDLYTEEFMYSHVNSSNNSRVFEKYIDKNKYYVFFMLFITKPFSPFMLVECSPSNMINIYHSKDPRHNNCIYIFFNPLTNKVTHIRHITKN